MPRSNLAYAVVGLIKTFCLFSLFIMLLSALQAVLPDASGRPPAIRCGR